MDDDQKLKEINEFSIAFRGTILNECIFLEKALDDFIAKDISLDEKVQVRIFQILLDRMTFEGKITAFNWILDDGQNLAGFIKSKKNGYPHKRLIEDIKRIKNERNYFAHYPAWLQSEAIQYHPNVGFINFRDKTKIEWYNTERITKLLELISKTKREIYKMISEMISTEPPL